MNSSYSPDFKQNAVELAVESDQSVAQTARDLGVNANTLYTWITKYHQAGAPINKGSVEKHPYEEFKRLRKENADMATLFRSGKVLPYQSGLKKVSSAAFAL